MQTVRHLLGQQAQADELNDLQLPLGEQPPQFTSAGHDTTAWVGCSGGPARPAGVPTRVLAFIIRHQHIAVFPDLEMRQLRPVIDVTRPPLARPRLLQGRESVDTQHRISPPVQFDG